MRVCQRQCVSVAAAWSGALGRVILVGDPAVGVTSPGQEDDKLRVPGIGLSSIAEMTASFLRLSSSAACGLRRVVRSRRGTTVGARRCTNRGPVVVSMGFEARGAGNAEISQLRAKWCRAVMGSG